MDLVHPTADPMTLVRRVGDLIDAGRPDAAGPLLAAARKLIEPSPELSLLAARLAEGQGGLDKAREELDGAIAATPGHRDLRKQRAALSQRMGDFECAARDAAEAVIIDPADPGAKALLGAAMLSLGHTTEAMACLGEACAAEPRNPSFREAFAVAMETKGDAAGAFATLQAGLSVKGGALNLRNAAVLFCIRHSDFARAIALAEEGRIAGTVDACLFGLMGHAQSTLGEHEAAADSYAEALKLGPEDPYVRHLVAASGLLPSASRAPPDYLRAVFDGYADRFDEHLIALGYQIPGAIRRVVTEYLTRTAGAPCGPVLDLGCGTGLVAVAIADLPIGRLTGVDVSRRMLDGAKAKGLYSMLTEADIMDWLADEAGSFELILAADVLCYFGSLEAVFRAVHERLRPGGWFILSLEERAPHGPLGGPGWRLQRQGRYAHTVNYVEETARATGFSVVSLGYQSIRHEGGAPVRGILAVLVPAPSITE